ncbi:SDR family oxidoreductase [Sneathiella sp. P13V-1]|uniref:SDR family oxidoreductase n=1 Tax=Sneathiella sp. P13V-1 TaxID=2697366 RepID=UPI00187B2E91|nr:SDR family oxidoreductase [Sneathiella sp. P13V-1]MBE7638053.1 SDR family oxidoreductase [Sneathiella sp. P13V-1]
MSGDTKNALITGAGKRIGRAIALRLAKDGWNIAIHYRNSQNEADALRSEVEALGSKAVAIQADLEDASQTRRLFEQAVTQFKTVHCLINNASLFEPDAISNVTDDSFHQHINANLYAPLILTREMAKQRNKQPELKGNIVNIVDQRVLNLRPDFVSYTLSKSALWTLTQTSAMDLAPHIRVNAIGPGPTLPNSRQSQELFEKQLQGIPLQKGPCPDEIAEGVLFLINSNSITGEFIAMDGGQHLPTSTAVEEF